MFDLGHDDVLKVLITNGADVNITAKNDWTVLHSATLSSKLMTICLSKSSTIVNVTLFFTRS